MPGVRLGGIYTAQAKLMQRLRALQPEWSVSGPAQELGCMVLQHGDYLQQTRALLETERAYLIEGLRALGFTVYDSDCNFVLFRGAEGLQEKLEHKGILIRTCDDFSGLGASYYRIAVRTHQDNSRLLETIKEC